MEEHDVTSLPASVKLPFEANAHNITPFFKVITPLNVAKSEELGKEVYDSPMEAVELRFAGDRNYAPVLPADSMYRRHGTRVITYAERFSEQYHAFMTGGNQVAGGTALEALQDYGITPAQLSVCRALKIYSIEALHALEGNGVKNLGMNANSLKEMAAKYMADRSERDAAKAGESIESMQEEIARLRALLPQTTPEPEQVDAIVAAADDEYAAMSNDEIKDRIADIAGSKPRGNPSRETLVQSLRELEGAA